MSYSPPPPISLAIQSTSAARSALPVYHRLRDSIEAYLTIVVAARAVGRWIEHQTGWPIRKFVKIARCYHTIQIQADQQRTNWHKSGPRCSPR